MEEFTMQKVFFIGAGSMAEAIIRGLIKQEVVPAKNIYVNNRSNIERLQHLHKEYGVQILENKEQLQDADLVILAMKPKDTQAAFEDLATYLPSNTAAISVIAGIEMDEIERGLGKRPIARIMPNTSATLGLSASGIAFNELVTATQKKLYLEMFGAIGVVIEVREDQLHAVTALSGSGPAYVYYLMEAWEKIGTELGLPKETVRKLMVQTLAGSAAMVQYLNEDPSELRRKVTSPGGTTEAGIKALEAHHFEEAIFECIKSAEKRSRELAAGK